MGRNRFNAFVSWSCFTHHQIQETQQKKKINNNIRMYMRLCVHVATSRERIPRGKPSLKRNEISTVDLLLLVWAQNWIGATSVREQFVWMRKNNVRFFASRLGDKCAK